DAVLVYHAYHAYHFVYFIAVIELPVAHMSASRVGHFVILKMELGRTESVKRAYMVVMHVRDDHVFYRSSIYVQQRQAFHRGANELPTALAGHFGTKAGIHDKNGIGIPDEPDVIIHWHGRVVRIPANKVIGSPSIARGISDCINFVFGQANVHLVI